MIKRGDIVQIKPRWRDAGDEKFTWVAVCDEDKGRVDIQPVDIALHFKPIYTVTTDMLEV